MPLTPVDPPSHHKTMLPSSFALVFACSHIASPTVVSQVRAGPRIRDGRESKFVNTVGDVKSRHIDEVIRRGRVWSGAGAQSGLVIPFGFFSFQ